MFRFIIALFIIFVIAGCSPFSQDDIIGHWEAVEVLEEGRLMELDPSEISLKFDADHYLFTSTISYKEAGHYALEGNHLLTRDTMQQQGKVNKLELIKLTKDSLQLKMLEQSKQRILKMKRTD